MSSNKKNYSTRQIVITFILSFLVFAEIILYINVKEALLMLILKSAIPAIVATVFIVLFWKRFARFYMRTFYKDFKYNDRSRKR